MQRNIVEKEEIIIAYGDIFKEEQDVFKLMLKKWRILSVSERDVTTTVIKEV